MRVASRLPTGARTTGYFSIFHGRLDGIGYANWGSRPYEYFWASRITPLRAKRVLDLGVGLPSQYGWYEHVRSELVPELYHGIDHDERIRAEEIREPGLVLEWGDMTNLPFADECFDVALCLSVFEHLNIDQLQASCVETSRVLDRDGLLLVTLDEVWDARSADVDWNVLERAAIDSRCFERKQCSFGLSDFAELVAPWFEPVAQPTTKRNCNRRLVHSVEWNSCVSYGVFSKRAAAAVHDLRVSSQ
jgi:ubiquinone/menaquinone biosynthesis C-methylase UbiE